MRVDLTGSISISLRSRSTPARSRRLTRLALSPRRGAPGGPREPPPESGHEQRQRDAGRVVDGVGDGPEPAPHDGILGDHLAGDIAEYPAADPDDPRVTGHQPRQEPAPPHHEGQRERDP